MRAVVFDQPGDPDVLHVAEVADPPGPAAGEVLIEVAATAVNRADLLQRQGFYPPPPGASTILGLECSGRVAATGEGVSWPQVGDEVCALLSGGGYATRVVVAAGQCMPLPAGIGVLEAAALPEVACTVWANLLGSDDDGIGATAHVRDGDAVLIHGGSSGIGTMAIQQLRILRPHCRIAVTAGSAAKLQRCQELGADILINYREQDFVDVLHERTDGHGADVVLDNMGAKYLSRNLQTLARDGRLVILGMQGGTKAELDLGALMQKRGAVITTSLRGRPTEQKARVCAGVVREVWPAVADGRIRPVIDRVLPLDEARQAHQAVNDSSHIGKVLLHT